MIFLFKDFQQHLFTFKDFIYLFIYLFIFVEPSFWFDFLLHCQVNIKDDYEPTVLFL